MKSKKSKVVVILIIVTISIWGIIFYNLYGYFTGNNDEIIGLQGGNNSLLKKNHYEINSVKSFRQLQRDPFTYTSPEREEKISYHPAEIISKPIQQYNLNSFIVTGVIINEENKLAIIYEPSANKTSFVREGEKYDDIQIKKINLNSVIIKTDKQEKELKIK